ncbi:hypothetical protein BDF19DRAFT_435719 [Syncephalis fuscata]|nr:hypothetical protein BDF19DRAFT_435719 [Syncephalis fuscata]
MNHRLLGGIVRGAGQRSFPLTSSSTLSFICHIPHHTPPTLPVYTRRQLFGIERKWQHTTTNKRAKTPTMSMLISRATSRLTWTVAERQPTASLSTASAPGSNGNNAPPPPKKGGLKHLFTVYGRIGIIAYLGVSAIDYACCFLVVRAAGEEKIATMEHWLRKNLGKYSLFPTKKKGDDYVLAPEILDDEDRVQDEAARERALQKNSQDAEGASSASIGTLLLVAYGIHKIVMPLRVALTVMIVPSIAKRFGHIPWLVGKKAAAKSTPSNL